MQVSHSLRSVARSALVVMAVVLLVGLAPAAVAGVGVDATTAHSGVGSPPTAQSTAAVPSLEGTTGVVSAGSTSVTLEPTDASVSEGETRTFDVVVTDASGGVGAIEGRISVADTNHAAITDFSFKRDPAVDDVSMTADGGAVSFRGAVMDTAESGSIVVGQVTVVGKTEGDTDLSLSIDALGDEDGAPYDVGATVDAGLSVGNSKNSVALEVTSSVDSASVGDEVTFTVKRVDSNAEVGANVSVGGQRIQTGIDGSVTVTITEEMVTDGGTVTAVATKAPRSEETFVNDSATIDVGPGTDDDGTDDDGDDANDGTNDTNATENDSDAESKTAGTATVGFSPSTVRLQPGQTKRVAVVVSNTDTAIGAAEFNVSVEGDDSITIVDVEPRNDPGVEAVEIGPDNRSVDARLALLDSPSQSPVRLLVVTVASDEPASGTLSVSVSALGSASGGSYAIGATPAADVVVDESVTTTTTTTGSKANETDSTSGTAATTERSSTAAPSTSTEEPLPSPVPGFTLSATVLALLLLASRRR